MFVDRLLVWLCPLVESGVIVRQFLRLIKSDRANLKSFPGGGGGDR